MSNVPLGQRKRIARSSGGRVIKQRPVTFRCGWCGHLVTELRYPSPTPVYGTACKTEALRYAEAAKKARQRGSVPAEPCCTTSCWDSPANLLLYGYIDPQAEALARAAVEAHVQQGRIYSALDARNLDRTNDAVREFLEECGL